MRWCKSKLCVISWFFFLYFCLIQCTKWVTFLMNMEWNMEYISPNFSSLKTSVCMYSLSAEWKELDTVKLWFGLSADRPETDVMSRLPRDPHISPLIHKGTKTTCIHQMSPFQTARIRRDVSNPQCSSFFLSVWPDATFSVRPLKTFSNWSVHYPMSKSASNSGDYLPSLRPLLGVFSMQPEHPKLFLCQRRKTCAFDICFSMRLIFS